MRGGGSKAVWNFSENSSVLEVRGIPKHCEFIYLTFGFFALHCLHNDSIVTLLTSKPPGVFLFFSSPSWFVVLSTKLWFEIYEMAPLRVGWE